MKSREELIDIILNNKNGIYFRESVFSNLFSEEYEDLKIYSKTYSLEFNNFSQSLYHYLYDIPNIVTAKCGNVLSFVSFKKGYRNYCKQNCRCMIDDCNIKRVENSIKKYGVVHPNMLEENKNKISTTKKNKSKEEKEQIVKKQKETFIARYGEDNPNKVKSIIEKRVKTFKENIEQWKANFSKTCLERYGVDNPLKCDKIREKGRNTLIEKYGVDNPMKSATIQNKIKNTCIEKYGVEHPSKVPQIKEKCINTFIEKYGVDNPSKNIEVRKKISNKLKKSRNEKTFKRNSEILKINENTFICKCINPSCELFQTCEHVYEISKSVFLQRKRYGTEVCIIKNKLGSHSGRQIDLLSFISSIYKNNISFNDRKILDSGKEIDIYLPELKIGFEFNGDYWHFNPLYYPVSNEEKWIADMQKQYEANMQGISLYTIWENDWLENQEYVKNKIKYIIENKLQKFSPYFYLKTFIDELSLSYTESVFGQFEFDDVIVKYVNAYYYNKNTIDKSWFLKSNKRVIYVYDYEITDIRKFDILKSEIRYALNLTTNKIFARKCEIREITNKEAKPFLTENSLFGHRNASVTLGLYYNNELVMLYSFGNNYYGQKKDVEVIRVCTKKNIVVVGGSSKCLKYYLEKYRNELNGKNLIFYVDKIHHDGKSLKDNFEFIKHEYGTMNYWRVDYQDETFCGEFGTAFNRSPSKHKEIKELIENDIILPCLTEGVDVYKMKI